MIYYQQCRIDNFCCLRCRCQVPIRIESLANKLHESTDFAIRTAEYAHMLKHWSGYWLWKCGLCGNEILKVYIAGIPDEDVGEFWYFEPESSVETLMRTIRDEEANKAWK